MRAMASEAWVPRANLPIEYRWNFNLAETNNGCSVCGWHPTAPPSRARGDSRMGAEGFEPPKA